MKSMKMMKKQAQAGFTLIELMIVVAIIGILAAVAIPQYSNYTIKAKLANAMTAVDPFKTAVGTCIQEAGNVLTGCTTGVAAAGLPTFSATKEVSALAVADGIITVTLGTGIGTDIDTKTFTVTPVPGTGSITWKVDASNLSANATAQSALEKNNIPTTP